MDDGSSPPGRREDEPTTDPEPQGPESDRQPPARQAGGDSTVSGGEAGQGLDESGGESDSSDPLELFFDLVFVFAFTRVTTFVAHHASPVGLLKGALLLAALWWAWVTYTWLMDTIPEDGLLAERLGVLAATAAMFVVALGVQNAFSDTAALFGGTYFVVRLLHVVLTVRSSGGAVLDRFTRLVPGFLGGPGLLLLAAFTDGRVQFALWIVGIAVDYGVFLVRGVAKYRVNVSHFVDRYRSIIIIALGESVLAMGFGIIREEPTLPAGVVVVAVLGILLTAALAWLYFDYVTVAAEGHFASVEGYERGRLARNSYAYIHLVMVAGILLVALGLEGAVPAVGAPLGLYPAAGLYGGTALYLAGHIAFRLHDIGSVSLARLIAAVVAALLVVPMGHVGTLLALAVIVAGAIGLVVFETVFSTIRAQVIERGGLEESRG
ncbi:MAG: low temperature requirement protein A [Haloarculaceae archaeon]